MALTAQQRRAAALLAEGTLPDAAIAAQLGTSRAALARWKQRADFAALLAELAERSASAATDSAILTKAGRLKALAVAFDGLERVIEARKVDPELLAVTGGSTGLVALRSVTKTGDRIYGVDTGLLRELRETAKQSAIELGQWEEKTRVENVAHVPVRSILAVQPAVTGSPDVD